jgi:beta-galactosidase
VRNCGVLLLIPVSAALTFALAASAQTTLTVDARTAAKPAVSLGFDAGGKGPDGCVLGVNSRYLTLNGKPWFPVMAEMHFSRFPASGWEDEILKIRAAGVQILSTYVFWIHHEEVEGRFDWSGQRDLRRFVQLCGKHGLMVWMRVGPWAHGEARNGGLPDWLLRDGAVRQNDPAYLAHVRRFYGEIGSQLKGLMAKDGGPVVGVQIENEYTARGPGKGAEHILTLRGLAREAGLEAPFYTVTGWDRAAVPDRDVLPVFGGYADAFWDRRLTELPPNPNFFFTPIRPQDSVGDDLKSKRPDLDAQYEAYPFFTAEMGGGMQVAYHRRPLMNEDDVAAPLVVKVGSGVNLYGYYMFHGGINPDGKLTTLQESQATNYPQDLPVYSYDFQAPLGQFGQERPSYRRTKLFHLFLNDFGSDLAPMPAYFPERTPAGLTDRDTVRFAVRMEGNRGYLFLNNYQRNHPLPKRTGIRFAVKTAAGTVEFPQRGIDIPAGAYLIWPINQEFGGVHLRYATAQPLCKLEDENTFVFFSWPGIPAEFAFDTHTVRPSADSAFTVKARDGRTVRFLLLSRDTAESAWKATVSGRERLILSKAEVLLEGNRIELRSRDVRALELWEFPGDPAKPRGGIANLFTRYVRSVSPVAIPVRFERVRAAAPAAPAKMGKTVAMAPDDADFVRAGVWRISVPRLAAPGVSVFLRIEYVGDVARLYEGDHLLLDDFYKGDDWEVGLGAPSRERTFDLKVLPLRKDAPIYLSPEVRPEFPPSGAIGTVTRVIAVPEYRAFIELRH